MDPKIFAERLRILRERHEMTQEELAERLHLSKKTISAYETGRAQPTLSTLAKIADILNTTADYLLGTTDDPRPQRQKMYTERDFETIPVYNGACAGNGGAYPDGSTIIEYVQIPKDMPGQFGVKVIGDSMEPEFYEGDIVIVNPDLVYVNNDRVVVLLSDPYYFEPTAVVKIYREQNGVRYLQSRNEKYPPIILTNNTQIHFVGKIVGLYRKY